jgi:hypothetical protein
MRKQEKCQTFAQDAGVQEMMVTTGTKHALNCGNMTLAWQEWKRHPLIDHMWNNWKDHWTAAFAEMRDINHMTSSDLAFASQAATQEIVQAEKMAASLDNLANASIQKMIPYINHGYKIHIQAPILPITRYYKTSRNESP